MFWLTLWRDWLNPLRFLIMAFDLARVLRSLLFASPGSISVKDIQTVFTRFHEEASSLQLTSSDEDSAEAGADGTESTEAVPGTGSMVSDVPSLVTASQIREAIDVIQAQLEASGEIFRVQETHNGWRFVTTPDCAEWVRLFRNQPKPVKLSQAVLETLAIIAYRQPVVRAEIEAIRGVSADGAINRLLERELIQIIGRADLPGRPIQYGTTEAFLEFVGVKSLDELPASDVLSARDIDQWLKRHEEPHTVTDSEVGLDTESGDETADLEIAPEPGHAGDAASPIESERAVDAAESVAPESASEDADAIADKESIS